MTQKNGEEITVRFYVRDDATLDEILRSAQIQLAEAYIRHVKSTLPPTKVVIDYQKTFEQIGSSAPSDDEIKQLDARQQEKFIAEQSRYESMKKRAEEFLQFISSMNSLE